MFCKREVSHAPSLLVGDARPVLRRTEPSVSLEDGPGRWIQSGRNTGLLLAVPTPLVPLFPQTQRLFLTPPEVRRGSWGCTAGLWGLSPTMAIASSLPSPSLPLKTLSSLPNLNKQTNKQRQKNEEQECLANTLAKRDLGGSSRATTV